MNRLLYAVLLLIAGAPVAAAQSTVSGAVEWTASQTSNTTDSQVNDNAAFWQNYSLGFHFPVLDPRLLKLDTEVTFRSSQFLARGSDRDDQTGRQDDLGYQLGAFVLPAGAFPFHVQASRVFTGSTGELVFSNPVRGSLAPSSAFETEDRRLSVGGQLNVATLPRAEVSYRRGSRIAAAGTDDAEERDEDLLASVAQENATIRQSLRYQRTGYVYELGQAFAQHLDNLDYDFNARIWGHVQLSARAGQRMTLTRSAVLPIDPADDPYAPPPTDGRSDTTYATGGLSYEPTSRVALRINGIWDQQQSGIAMTRAALGTGSFHAEVVRGLLLKAAATSGQRGQMIDGELIEVRTANGVAGFTYSGGPRWLNGTISANVGQGSNATPDGTRGDTRSWAREASLASSLGWFGVGGGYERVMNRDGVLDYGNYDSERVRASVSLQSARLSLDGSADRLEIIRGYGETLAHNRQDTMSASLAGRLWREITLTGTAGGFTTTYLSSLGHGLDQSVFWGVGAQMAMLRSLRFAGWIRNEEMLATGTRYDQRVLSALARVEYRLRALNFAVEYRHNDSHLQYGDALFPTRFRGHQVRFSLSRQFGFRM